MFFLRLLWMVFGRHVLKLVVQFSFLDSMVLHLLFLLSPVVTKRLSICFPNFDICLMFQTVGELLCPAYHELCSTHQASVSRQCANSCNLNGDCVDGRCHCFVGFHGHDCSKRKLLIPLPYFAFNEDLFLSNFAHLVRVADIGLFYMQASALAIAMGMDSAYKMVSVIVRMDTLALTALPVM